MALAKAKELNIPAETNPGLNKDYPAGTGCCSDLEPFDEAGIPVLAVEATDWTLGDKDGYEQTSNPAIKGGLSWHLADVDNVKNMDKVFPGRIKQRATDFSRILTPVLLQIAGAKK
jgi:alkaline phosphatase isozyme conversion protein